MFSVCESSARLRCASDSALLATASASSRLCYDSASSLLATTARISAVSLSTGAGMVAGVAVLGILNTVLKALETSGTKRSGGGVSDILGMSVDSPSYISEAFITASFFHCMDFHDVCFSCRSLEYRVCKRTHEVATQLSCLSCFSRLFSTDPGCLMAIIICSSFSGIIRPYVVCISAAFARALSNVCLRRISFYSSQMELKQMQK